MPLGLLGEPSAPRTRVALRRPARLACRDDRPARGCERPRRARVQPSSVGPRARDVPAPLRDAVPAGAEGASRGHRSWMPCRGRRAPPCSGERVACPPSAPARELHDAAAAGRRRADPGRAPLSAGHRRGRDRRPPRQRRHRRGVRAGQGRGPIGRPALPPRRRGRRRPPTAPSVSPRRRSSSSRTDAGSWRAGGSPCWLTTS